MADWLEAPSPASAARPAHEPAVPNLNERRIAWDGEAYTFEELSTYYGFASGLAIWRKSECRDSAEQPVGINQAALRAPTFIYHGTNLSQWLVARAAVAKRRTRSKNASGRSASPMACGKSTSAAPRTIGGSF